MKLNQISTKKGDEGKSKNYSNETISKTDILFDTLGTIDELSSILGVTFHHTDYKQALKTIQMDLQHIMSLIATTNEDVRKNKLVHITVEDIQKLEALEQQILDITEIKPKFVLPGSDSTIESAYLDFSRSVSRRAERTVLKFTSEHNRDDLKDVLSYLNRLSDLLFLMARSR